MIVLCICRALGTGLLAGGYFGVRTAAAVAAVVAQQLRRHPWLSAVDSQSGLRCLRGQSLYFVEAYKKAENLMSSLESFFIITINESKGRYILQIQCSSFHPTLKTLRWGVPPKRAGKIR